MDPEKTATILSIEDDDFLRTNIAAYLTDSGYQVLEAGSGRLGVEVYRRERPDLVLLDLRLPGLDGLEVLRLIREDSKLTPVIVVSGMGIFADVVTSLRLGAWDYLIKPIEDMEVLSHAVRNALEKARLLKENRDYQQHLEEIVASRTSELERVNQELELLSAQLERENEYLRDEFFANVSDGPFVGRSVALARILEQIDQVAPTGATVLVTGETGTGKELVARLIHQRGRRSKRPLVKVNCATVPRDLFESEFFGHARGAFTGAIQDRVGRFQLADKSTLFLDEVGEIPIEMQGKLLRVMQDGEFESLGEDATRTVDVHVIAATNRKLAYEVEEGRFREDLFYRLNVYPIHVPPLRERVEDIAPLATHFLDLFARKLGIPVPVMKQRHMQLLQDYHWPGNVRELQNVIERASIISRGGSFRIELPTMTGQAAKEVPRAGSAGESGAVNVLTQTQMRQRERQNILSALTQSNWRVFGPRGAAKLLDLKPTTLASRMKALGIQKPS